MPEELNDNSHDTQQAVTVGGAFESSLKRNNKQIREDRAEGLLEDASLAYERLIQDKRRELKRLQRDALNMIDLSPTNSYNLMLGTDFDASKYATLDLDIAIKVRNLEIEIDLAEKRYKYLFGREV